MSRIVRVEACAMAAHEANRAYCAAIGDYVKVSWRDASEHQKESCRAGVEGVLDGNTPEASHEAWMALKLANGWTQGPTINEAVKQHPCLLPYAQLPLEQKQKDHIFVQVVLAMAQALHLESRDASGGLGDNGVCPNCGDMAGTCPCPGGQ